MCFDGLSGCGGGSRIYGLGESFGASILIQAAAKEPFAAMVSESAYADLQDAAVVRLRKSLPQPLAWFAAVNAKVYARVAYGLDFNLASPLDAMQQSSTPRLLIHGLEDDQTPAEHSRRLYAARRKGSELWLVPGVPRIGLTATSIGVGSSPGSATTSAV